MTTITQTLLASTKQPREAHIYNAAAELLRDNPASPEIALTRKQYKGLAGGGLDRLLFRLGQEFGREHVNTLVITVYAEGSLSGPIRHYIRFRRNPA